MADRAWKAFERWVCKKFGLVRRGAYDSGNDCVCEDRQEADFSIECKLWDNIHYQVIINAIQQARDDAKTGAIPVAVVKKKGKPNAETIACMFLDDYINYFGGAE